MKLKATVIKGVQIGSKFGIATANLAFQEKPRLKEGVYLVDVFLKDTQSHGLLHFGELKTFGGKFSVELHILNFEKDIYGQELEIQTLKYLRDVVAFSNSDALYSQIETDILHAEKFFIRRKVKSKWGSVSRNQRSAMATKAIAIISQDKDFKAAKTLFAYAPDDQEIPFVEGLMTQFPEKNWYFPRIENGQMTFHPASYQDLRPGYLNILEPSVRTLEFKLKPDLIIVPAVAGTMDGGQRLGRGGGFYDRFLAHNQAKTICLLPKFAIKPALPVEKHDQSIDKIIKI